MSPLWVSDLFVWDAVLVVSALAWAPIGRRCPPVHPEADALNFLARLVALRIANVFASVINEVPPDSQVS